MSRIVDNKSIDTAIEDLSIRPRLLDEYIGQDSLKNNFKIYIGAALKRCEVLDHVLLYGPPGLGKTTFARIVANEMHVNFKSINAPSIEKIGDIACVLTSLQAGDILFIDEIHRLPLIIEESLYSAMEDYKFSIVINRETSPKNITFDLPPFTLIGATTKPGCLSSPLRSRFGISEKLDFYSINDLAKIVIRMGKVFNVEIKENAAYQIAKRSRGTPRIAIRIFKRVRDYANYKNLLLIDEKQCLEALKLLRIDDLGLDEVDALYIKTLISRFNGGPVGIETLANSIGEESVNLEDVYEPYLLKLGFIDRTPKGRIAKKPAYLHFKMTKKYNLT